MLPRSRAPHLHLSSHTPSPLCTCCCPDDKVDTGDEADVENEEEASMMEDEEYTAAADLAAALPKSHSRRVAQQVVHPGL